MAWSEVLGGGATALRWLDGIWPVTDGVRSLVFLAGAALCFALAAAALIYVAIKDLDPGELEVKVGPMRIMYRARDSGRDMTGSPVKQ